ncbi:MAG: hypothetical protein H5T59_06140 [Anaerolineae bacterium]|nr:hypothetical protein [Anaerolineae bacterium]
MERRARENIALAASLGVEPVYPILYYERARVLREGDVEDKLTALQDYWRASLQAQALAVLSGKMVVE